MATSSSRLREFELRQAGDRRRQERQWRQEAGNYGYKELRRRRPGNTLAPMEDVLDERWHRSRVAMAPSQRSASSRQLRENVIMLLVLAASIYGLYHLCIYVLNQ